MEEGFAALSHRSVARRADLPLSATTYYFASLDQLVHDVVRGLAAGWLVRAVDVVDALPRTLDDPQQVADAILRLVTLGPADGSPVEPTALLTIYERYLEAARHPHLRAVIAEYDGQLDTLVADVLRRGGLPGSTDTAHLVLALVDGALLRALAEGRPVGSAIGPLQHLVRVLATSES